MKHKYSILTSGGFKDFEGVKETHRDDNIRFTFNDKSTIIVTPEHRFFVGKSKGRNIFRRANKISIGHTVSGKKVICKEYDVVSSGKFYDLINVEGGNHYITSGVTSHNCAFIRPNIWEEFIDSFLPSQAALSWKKNIILSTPKGMNHFYDLVKGASPHYESEGSGIKEPGERSNGYKLFKVDWKDVPRFNAKGQRMKPEDFMNGIISKHGMQYWRQNFECNFLGSSSTLISAEKLSQMTSQECEEIRDGKLKIYQYPEKGHQYIMTVDAAKDGTDFFAVQVVDITDFNFKQVAAAQLQIDYLLMPEFINEWAEMYNNPYLIIENNEGAGQSIADQMKNDYEYENLHYDKDVGRNRKKKYPGFRTTPKTRKQILQTLKLFIENDKLEVVDRATIQEFFQFILINNKYQADEGAHDDMIMSLGLVFVPFCNSRNFEDMKLLVKNLYDDAELSESEKVNFGEMMTIGSFDDGTDEEYLMDQGKKEYMTMEEFMEDQEGFF